MKKYILMLLACFAMNAHALCYYSVSTADRLREALSSNDYVIIELMNDIDISSFGDTRFHNDSSHPFIGVINGNGHCLKNYKYDHGGINKAGLITYCGKDFANRAVIKDITLKDFFVKGDNDVAFLATIAKYTLFKNVTIEGGTFYCDDQWAGSIAAEAADCVFDGCVNRCGTKIHAGSEAGDSNAGGICGQAKDCLFYRCVNLTDVTCDNDYCGGIVSQMDDSSVNSCIAVGTVSSNNDDCTGGIVGYMDDSSVRNCVFKGTVSSCDDGICFIVGENASDNYRTNNYYWTESTSNLNSGDAYIAASDNDFKSGALAYHINQVMGGEAWRQGIGVDEYPLPTIIGPKYQVYSPIEGKYSNWNVIIDGNVSSSRMGRDYLQFEDGKDLVVCGEFYAGNVSYIRNSPPTWGTACVPFDITPSCTKTGTEVYYLSDVDSEGQNFIVKKYADDATIPAGTPFFVKYTVNGMFPAASISSIDGTVKKGIHKIDGENNPDIMPENEQWSMNATYEKLTNQTGVYFISNNAFWKANDPISIPALRAWFENPSISSSVKSIGIMVDEDGIITRVGSINAEEVMNNNGIFNLQGQHLDAPRQNQVNIINGKKVLVK